MIPNPEATDTKKELRLVEINLSLRSKWCNIMEETLPFLAAHPQAETTLRPWLVRNRVIERESNRRWNWCRPTRWARRWSRWCRRRARRRVWPLPAPQPATTATSRPGPSRPTPTRKRCASASSTATYATFPATTSGNNHMDLSFKNLSLSRNNSSATDWLLNNLNSTKSTLLLLDEIILNLSSFYSPYQLSHVQNLSCTKILHPVTFFYSKARFCKVTTLNFNFKGWRTVVYFSGS